MRESQTKKIPYTLVIGDKERDEEKLSFRHFGNQDTVTLNIDEFIDMMNTINNKKNSQSLTHFKKQ